MSKNNYYPKRVGYILMMMFVFVLWVGGSEANANLKNDIIIHTEEATLLGITVENYPQVDGSTSTSELSQGIYSHMFKNRHPEKYKEHSKTVPAYEKLIKGEVDLIFVPNPSEEIKKLARDSGVELVYSQ